MKYLRIKKIIKTSRYTTEQYFIMNYYRLIVDNKTLQLAVNY